MTTHSITRRRSGEERQTSAHWSECRTYAKNKKQQSANLEVIAVEGEREGRFGAPRISGFWPPRRCCWRSLDRSVAHPTSATADKAQLAANKQSISISTHCRCLCPTQPKPKRERISGRQLGYRRISTLGAMGLRRITAPIWGVRFVARKEGANCVISQLMSERACGNFW